MFDDLFFGEGAPDVRAALARPAPGGLRLACPRRHLFALPRGRGPSQTPPSLATDSSISPGPPSPWLPALPIERLFYRFRGEPRAPLCAGHLLGRLCKCRKRFNARGCKGRSPLHKITFSPPLPAGKGVGGMGAETKLKAGAAGDQKGKPPSGTTAAGITSAARKGRGAPAPHPPVSSWDRSETTPRFGERNKDW